MKKIILLAIIIITLASCRGDWAYKTNPHDDNPPHMDISLDKLKGVWQVREYSSNSGNYPWKDIRKITRNKDYFYFQLLDDKNGVIKNLTDHDVKFTFFGKFNEYTGKPSADYVPIDSVLNPKKKSYHIDVDKFSNDSLVIYIDDYSEFNFDPDKISYDEKIGELVFIRVKQ